MTLLSEYCAWRREKRAPSYVSEEGPFYRRNAYTPPPVPAFWTDDRKRRLTFSTVAIGLLVALMTIVGALFTLQTYETTVAAVTWNRIVSVERFAYHHHSGFSENIPPGSEHVVQNGSRLHHYFTTFMLVGKTFIPINNPVYASWYEWDVWDWGHDRDVSETGSTVEASWPEPEKIHLNEGLQPREEERSKRFESYGVTLRYVDGKTVGYEPGPADFREFRIGSKWLVRSAPLRSVQIVRRIEGS